MRSFIISLCATALLAGLCFAGPGDKPASLALKTTPAPTIPSAFRHDRSVEELWDAFMVMKKANAGDPVAEHELGLHYLFGKDFPADTQKAAYWIGKAAAKTLWSAKYNYGLLLNNGWGVVWNPFEAFRNFEIAAQHGLPEAEYCIGLYYTDNLVVPRNYSEAFRWITKAAEDGYEPAAATLREFRRHGIVPDSPPAADPPKSSRSKSKKSRPPASASPAASSPRPVKVRFEADSAAVPGPADLLTETLEQGSERLSKLKDSVLAADSTARDIRPYRDEILAAADAGSPEASVLVGSWYEDGNGIVAPAGQADPVRASFYYLRGVRVDAPTAARKLWNLSHKKDYFENLRARVDAGDPMAAGVWAGLAAYGFDNRLTEKQVTEFLQRASDAKIPDAMVELGLCYYSGRGVTRNRERGTALLQAAADMGNAEAAVRLAMLELTLTPDSARAAELFGVIVSATAKGSVFAQTSLASCYATGRVVPVSVPAAVRLYRQAAQRGSNAAYLALKQMHDGIRPPDPRFKIPDSSVTPHDSP